MAAARPAGKVAELGPDCFSPRLVYNKQLVPLGEHDTRAAAEAAYDLGKMLVSLFCLLPAARPPVRRPSHHTCPCAAGAQAGRAAGEPEAAPTRRSLHCQPAVAGAGGPAPHL